MQKFKVSRDDHIYEAWPDVALTRTGRLVCVFSETTHHRDRSYTRIVSVLSDDRGRTWSEKIPVTEARNIDSEREAHWNCARIVSLTSRRLAATVDLCTHRSVETPRECEDNFLLFSDDDGETWSRPVPTPVKGIVPDRLVELRNGPWAGRWILGAHTLDFGSGRPVWVEHCWLSDNSGVDWLGPHVIACQPGLLLCEGSVLEMPGGEVICFMRENSGRGLGASKTVSRDGGETWEGVCEFPLPGCHRPVAGMLLSGRVMVTYRFMQGGRGWLGWWTQNAFAALTDVRSCLAADRESALARILPIDYDRSPESDTGYTGWIQFPDGEIYVVNYILDDAPKAWIRGYSLRVSEFCTDLDALFAET